MTAHARIIPVPVPGRFTTVRMERKALHRFLVAYITARGLPAHPSLRSLLIAGIDVYPGPFPIRVQELEEHLDAVVRVKLPYAGCPHAIAASLG